VAFCVNWGSGRDSGIYRKVAGQAAAWQAMGAEVGLFVATVSSAADDWSALPQTQAVAAARSRPGGRVAAREQAAAAARRWRADVGYVRHGLVYPGLIRLARQVPLVVEVNGDDLAESQRLGRGSRAATYASHGLGLRRAAGLSFVTYELSLRPSFARYGRPSVVVANGIDLAGVTRVPPAPLARRLIFLGHPRTPWHGTDKLQELARRLPDWRLDLVGPTAAELPGMPPNIRAHGLLQTDAYQPLLAAADVALGSLAMHRAGIEEASPLKVREYLAAGLPTVIGYRDTDFPHGADFLLELPNTEGNMVQAAALLPAFAQHWAGRRVPREAVQHLDAMVKERERLSFLERCAAVGRGS
jgi:glycosyltransferase involved in cell wall biosynthesis